MEGVFLKTSIQNEMDQFQPEDPSFLLPNVSNVDDFSIDELLDFSNEDGFMFQEDEQNEDNPTTLISSKARSSCGLSLKEDFALVSSSELDVPVEELESLEWLSHFVEDSNSEYSTPFPAGVFQPKPESEPEKTFQPASCFKTPVPAKARSKRTRTGAKIWSLGSPSITESSSSSTSSSSCSSLVLDPVEPVEKPVKKPKKKPSKGDGFPSTAMPRRCSHCGVQKTPQWRAGPLGPKTLCNACGVRFKSGRLFPEYRPACSPTFSSELHSNHHRKVLEMRKKKDAVLGEPGVLVPSF